MLPCERIHDNDIDQVTRRGALARECRAYRYADLILRQTAFCRGFSHFGAKDAPHNHDVKPELVSKEDVMSTSITDRAAPPVPE